MKNVIALGSGITIENDDLENRLILKSASVTTDEPITDREHDLILKVIKFISESQLLG